MRKICPPGDQVCEGGVFLRTTLIPVRVHISCILIMEIFLEWTACSSTFLKGMDRTYILSPCSLRASTGGISNHLGENLGLSVPWTPDGHSFWDQGRVLLFLSSLSWPVGSLRSACAALTLCLALALHPGCCPAPALLLLTVG